MEKAESTRVEEYGQQIILRPIGIIRSPYRGSDGVPVQPVYARGCTGMAELRPELEEALKDLDGFSHLHLIYCFHQAAEPASLVKPHLGNSLRGVLATRSPRRPNPIGLSVVRLIRREGTRLHLDELDILDGSPLLDIKPFIADVDNRSASRAGWLEPFRPEMASLKRRSARVRKEEKT
jgi:tRNA-Thr(GGU) m(6)t(6)A37 methyltransferase TsaA